MKIIKCHSIVQSPNYSFRRIDHALNYLSIGIDMIFTNKESYPLVAINGNTSNTNLFCDLETYFITFYAMLDPAFTKLWKYRAAFYYSAEIKIKNEVFPHVRRERWLTIKILEETADFVFQAFFQKNLDFDHINYDDDSFNPYRFYAGELHNTLHLFTMMIILQKIFRRTFKFNFLNDPNFELYHSTGRRISGITGDVYVWFFKTYKMVFLIYMDHFTGKLVFRYVPYTVDANTAAVGANTAAIDAGFTFESLKKSLQRFDSLSDLWLFLLFLTENERTTKMGLLPYVDFPISRVPFRPVIGSTEHARNCFTHGNNIYAKYEDLGKFFINEPIFQTAQAGNRHNDKTVLFNAVFVLTCFVENKDDPQDIYGVFINSLGTEMIYPYSRFKKFEIRDYGRDLVGQLVDCFKFTCISRHFDGFDWERWKFILSETEDKA
ncbi:uncharacterized protein SCDLUD_004189 [Saccharomycodes ludwigii]|uniref:uncharacterized protein n=1 Tax=Saccharomycodes ludwigii TaxID=36035 RepID=UPI001E89037A|nr:hypothetical protein SCDLUD_004189 [Saccharomycodes ludwigii]KAH3899887.1 hypothetical protein SCDLUD_004189 [Saccharomycodes ludwigii]